MTNPRLEAKRASNEAKCANCKHWSRRDEQIATVGECERIKQMMTLDLSVCSGWELHEVYTGRIMKPDEVIEE